MNISFKIDCASPQEEIIVVTGSIPELGEWDPQRGLVLNHKEPHQWEGEIEVENLPPSFEYNYCKLRSKTKVLYESGEKRTISQVPTSTNAIRMRDFWRPEQQEDIVWRSNAFKNILTRRVDLLQRPSQMETTKVLRIQINGTTVEPMYNIGIVGNTTQLGNNDEENFVTLSNINYPYWHIDIDATNIEFPIQYKYVLIHRRTGKIARVEEGSERLIRHSGCSEESNYLKIHTDDKFRETEGVSRLAGFCIGVWQLRNRDAIGCGDFLSLKPLVAWCHHTGNRMIQLLPINAIHTPLHPERIYPFESKSAYALNPILLNLSHLASSLEQEIDASLLHELKASDREEEINFAVVTTLKTAVARQLYNLSKKEFWEQEKVQTFVAENKYWLYPYVLFEVLHQTEEWENLRKFNDKKVERYFAEENEYSFELQFQLFLQYQLYQQLKEVSQFARNYGIILDIELSTTIHTNSVETWQYPTYFDKKRPVGVLPNQKAQIDNQWDTASCHWQSMKRKKYDWWTTLFQHFGNYFDACRLADIETVFRSWHVPVGATQSNLGYFRPAIPYATNDLIEEEFWYDESMTKPYIREYFLEELFGEETEQVKTEFLNEYDTGKYEFKEKFSTQRKIFKYFAPRCTTEELTADEHRMLFGLMTLQREVLFIKDEDEMEKVHPRFGFEETYAYINLPEDQRAKLTQLCSDYFENRHDELWLKEAKSTLTALANGCRMLLSVDDVGMDLQGHENLFEQIGILSEVVQRIPNEKSYEFISATEIPYLSILYSSNPKGESLKQWWQNNPIDSERLAKYLQLSNRDTDEGINSWVAKEIIQRQFEGGSFAVLLTLQDLSLLGKEYETSELETNPLLLRSQVTIEELSLDQSLLEWFVATLKESDRYI